MKKYDVKEYSKRMKKDANGSYSDLDYAMLSYIAVKDPDFDSGGSEHEDAEIRFAARHFLRAGPIDGLVEERREVAELLFEQARKRRAVEREHRVFVRGLGSYQEDWEGKWDPDSAVREAYYHVASLYSRLGEHAKSSEVLKESAEYHLEKESYRRAMDLYKEIGMEEKARECGEVLAEQHLEGKDYLKAIRHYYALGMQDKVKEVWGLLSEDFLSGKAKLPDSMLHNGEKIGSLCDLLKQEED
ncbi:MAG: hypothetical protein ABIB71_06785 [Candidatus Woesearchaeota archaeon]